MYEKFKDIKMYRMRVTEVWNIQGIVLLSSLKLKFLLDYYHSEMFDSY